MPRTPFFCSDCGYRYSREEAPPCPACESTRRTYDKRFEGRVMVMGSLRLRHRRRGFPGFVVDVIERTKLSRRGRLAQETLTIDRSDPKKTIKRHRVFERQPDGTFERVHDERQEYPAKRRPDRA